MQNTLIQHPETCNTLLFENVVNDIVDKGYSINPFALPIQLADALEVKAKNLSESEFLEAGIGRGDDFVKSEVVRKDEIAWIQRSDEVSNQWLDWATQLQVHINQELFMGLFSFESHFAHYRPGDFYKKHVDAFKGERNRVLSLVVYLNSGWLPEYGGELALYHDKEVVKVTPLKGTVVVFLSEEVPHEVLKAHKDRYSIAGWFRVNGSVNNVIDPPR